MKKNKNVIIILIFFIVIILGIFVYNNIKNHQENVKINTYNITLNGSNELSIYEGEKYQELGFKAIDYQGKDANNLVKIDNKIDNTKIGDYYVIYSINNEYKTNEVKRLVHVIVSPLQDIDFKLNGEEEIDINIHDQYNDLGYTISDENFNKNVVLNGSVNPEKVGIYEISYTLTIADKSKTITRKVNVKGSKYLQKLNTTDPTNQSITITLTNQYKDFKSFINPNLEEIKEETINYVVTENGDYKFYIIDNNDNKEEIIVNINNIDREAPTGTCTGIIKNNITNINIDANDNNKIVKYTYNNQEYGNNFNINGKIENVSVNVSDIAGNIGIIKCDVIYEPNIPTGTIIDSYNSETLKYWYQKSDGYKLTYIWVKDAYNQFKTAIPSTFGTLATTENIMKYTISKNNYTDKGMVAINGSGFVSTEFDSSYYYKIKAWKNSAVTPIVIVDGKVIRDFTNQELPNSKYRTYGLSSDGYFKYYSFKNGKDISNNTKTAEQIINDGVKYTFGFEPVLVGEGNVSGNTKAVRQGICQLDLNNFIIVSNGNLTLNEFSNYMKNIGCKIAVNTDGGGSANEYYKKNDSTINSIRVTPRAIADIVYFVEK